MAIQQHISLKQGDMHTVPRPGRTARCNKGLSKYAANLSQM